VAVFSANVVDLNAVVYVVKLEGVCTFVTVRLVVRLKIAPELNGTRAGEASENRIYSDAESGFRCIAHKDCG
jgi:hypothetical protein